MFRTRTLLNLTDEAKAALIQNEEYSPGEQKLKNFIEEMRHDEGCHYHKVLCASLTWFCPSTTLAMVNQASNHDRFG